MAPAAIATFLQRLAAGLGGSRQSAAVPQLRALASLRCLSPPAHGIERSGAALRPSALPQRPPRGRRAAAAARRLLHVTAASYSVITGDSSSSSGDASSGGGDFGCQPWMLIVYSKAGCHLCEGLKEKLEALLERAAFMPSLLRWVMLCVFGQHAWQAKGAVAQVWALPPHSCLVLVLVWPSLRAAPLRTTRLPPIPCLSQPACLPARLPFIALPRPCPPPPRSTAELEVRDITTQPDWEQRYAMTIPVLAAAAADGSGEVGGRVGGRASGWAGGWLGGWGGGRVGMWVGGCPAMPAWIGFG